MDVVRRHPGHSVRINVAQERTHDAPLPPLAQPAPHEGEEQSKSHPYSTHVQSHRECDGREDIITFWLDGFTATNRGSLTQIKGTSRDATFTSTPIPCSSAIQVLPYRLLGNEWLDSLGEDLGEGRTVGGLKRLEIL